MERGGGGGGREGRGESRKSQLNVRLMANKQLEKLSRPRPNGSLVHNQSHSFQTSELSHPISNRLVCGSDFWIGGSRQSCWIGLNAPTIPIYRNNHRFQFNDSQTPVNWANNLIVVCVTWKHSFVSLESQVIDSVRFGVNRVKRNGELIPILISSLILFLEMFRLETGINLPMIE